MIRIANKLESTSIEREVEDVYNKGIALYFKRDVEFKHPYACDGYTEVELDGEKMLRLILEYKYDHDFTKPAVRAAVVVQVLFYLKRFAQHETAMPNVCLVGDKNECLVFAIDTVAKWLDANVDWSIAPSDAAARCPELVADIAEADDTGMHVFHIDGQTDFSTVMDCVVGLVRDAEYKIQVTERNISVIYASFRRYVLRDAKCLSTACVNAFLGIIKGDDRYYVHPKKPNQLCGPDGSMRIDPQGYAAFCRQYGTALSPAEKRRLDATSDRLKEDDERRRTGAFYTPTAFVDLAHRGLDEMLGTDWRDKYAVWDPAAGCLNLTRDYRFRELYCSTLEAGDLTRADRYNREAVKFRMDFLNDADSVMPEQLKAALNNKRPLVFLLNPPYGEDGVMGSSGQSKAGIADTRMRDAMHKDNLGAASKNLQHQFMYRIGKLAEKLDDVVVAIYTNPIWMTGAKAGKFRRWWCDRFEYKGGYLFNAGEFSGVSANWGISLTFWRKGRTEDDTGFLHHAVESADNSTGIVEVGTKTLYNVPDDRLLVDYIEDTTRCTDTADVPRLSSGCTVSGIDTLRADAIGALATMSDDVYHSATEVAMFSSLYSHKGTLQVPITPENYRRCCAVFAARRLVPDTWITHMDRFMRPDETAEGYERFLNDAVVYSLFEFKSNQSSLRDVQIDGRRFDVRNQFFWMSRDDMLELTLHHRFDVMYNDALTDTDRFIYTKLRTLDLSDDARSLLTEASCIVVDTMRYRPLFNDTFPDTQIMNWDCGWYQLKRLCKVYATEKLDKFNAMFRRFSNRLRPLVYSLGFLRR